MFEVIIKYSPTLITPFGNIEDINNDDGPIEDLKSAEMLSVANWKPHFCILMENDSKLFIFADEPVILNAPSIENGNI